MARLQTPAIELAGTADGDRLDLERLGRMFPQLETPRVKLVCLHLAVVSTATPDAITDMLDLPLTAVLPILARLEARDVVQRTDGGYRLHPAFGDDR